MFRRLICSCVIVSFFTTLILPVQKVHADDSLGLPVPGTMVNLSPAYAPVLIKGLKVHPENPLLFDFIIDTGHSGYTSDNPQLRQESEKLIKYFLATLTVPENDLWVNLSPYEKNRIIPDQLGKTELGREMLAQDYMLKQLTASLIYPEKNLGREFWNRVYEKSRLMFGSAQVPVNTFNKVWILPDKAGVFVRNNTAFVVQAHLKVMLEEDYLALQKHTSKGPITSTSEGFVSLRGTSEASDAAISSQIIREIILPEIEKEVNTGKNFSSLRQVFYSLILASWYKKNLKMALLNQVYSNKNKINGVDEQDKNIKDKIYQRYLEAYKKGVFNYIKEDIDQLSNQPVPRKYFSGGLKWGNTEGTHPKVETDVRFLDQAFESNNAMVSEIVTIAPENRTPELQMDELPYDLDSGNSVRVIAQKGVEFVVEGRNILILNLKEDEGDGKVKLFVYGQDNEEAIKIKKREYKEISDSAGNPFVRLEYLSNGKILVKSLNGLTLTLDKLKFGGAHGETGPASKAMTSGVHIITRENLEQLEKDQTQKETYWDGDSTYEVFLNAYSPNQVSVLSFRRITSGTNDQNLRIYLSNKNPEQVDVVMRTKKFHDMVHRILEILSENESGHINQESLSKILADLNRLFLSINASSVSAAARTASAAMAAKKQEPSLQEKLKALDRLLSDGGISIIKQGKPYSWIIGFYSIKKGQSAGDDLPLEGLQYYRNELHRLGIVDGVDIAINQGHRVYGVFDRIGPMSAVGAEKHYKQKIESSIIPWLETQRTEVNRLIEAESASAAMTSIWDDADLVGPKDFTLTEYEKLDWIKARNADLRKNNIIFLSAYIAFTAAATVYIASHFSQKFTLFEYHKFSYLIGSQLTQALLALWYVAWARHGYSQIYEAKTLQSVWMRLDKINVSGFESKSLKAILQVRTLSSNSSPSQKEAVLTAAQRAVNALDGNKTIKINGGERLRGLFKKAGLNYDKFVASNAAMSTIPNDRLEVIKQLIRDVKIEENLVKNRANTKWIYLYSGSSSKVLRAVTTQLRKKLKEAGFVTSIIERPRMGQVLQKGFYVGAQDPQKMLDKIRELLNDELNPAMTTQANVQGGIDFNARNLHLSTSGDKIDMRFNKAMIAQFERGDFSGVHATIISITPLFSVFSLFGIKASEG